MQNYTNYYPEELKSDVAKIGHLFMTEPMSI